MKNPSLAVFAAAILSIASCAPRDRYVTVTGYAQGGTYSVKFNMNGTHGRLKASPVEIRDSVESILAAIDASLSGYNRNSLLSRFNDGESMNPDTLFLDMYECAYDVYRKTSGCVDAAAAPLFDIWGFGFREGKLPDEDMVSAAVAVSGMARLRPDIRSVLSPEGILSPERLLCPGQDSLARLNYNAIAQGYSCDMVARYLYRIGVRDMMIDIGEIFCDGRNPSGKPWTIGIDRPEDGNDEPGADIYGIFRVPDGPHGIVTSGNYRKYYVKDGRKYAHTIDPRTGYPVMHNLLSATVLAEDATTADACATYCMVIGLEESKAFLSARRDLEGCLVYDEDGVFRTWCSEGFVLEPCDDAQAL